MDEKKRYQFFVSSTFTDLEVERGKVMETILNFDCFPAGMELFPAMDEEQFEYIKRIIDDSDYYMLIIGGRYGSEDSNGISWTEKEFDYAISKGIPVIAFDHKDFTQLLACRTDQDDKKRRKLVKFKNKVATGRLIVKWTNADDLALAVAKSLKKVLELQPRIGWVRADSVASGNAQKEIDRLKEQIKSLEDELKEYRTSLDKSKLKTETITVNGVSFKMVHVEGGTFMMGASDSDKDAWSNEIPAHQVRLSDYWLGETPVTQALWQAVMGENPSHFKGDFNRPVESVSWVECQMFIGELNKLTGKKFRLPTEAQWEFAARGGNLGKNNHYCFAGSDHVDVVAWFAKNAQDETHPVGAKRPNELGLYDMSGNVWEWCSDWYEKNTIANRQKITR